MHVNKDFMRLKQNKTKQKPFRERERQKEQKPAAKLTIWYILTKMQCPSQLSNTKSKERPQKTTIVHYNTIVSMVKKNFTASNQAKNTLKEVDLSFTEQKVKWTITQSVV